MLTGKFGAHRMQSEKFYAIVLWNRSRTSNTKNMINITIAARAIRAKVQVALFGVALAMSLSSGANAQDTTPPTGTVFRSGLWKQWIYWAIPGPTAFAAVQRIVAEVNVSRSAAGLPLLIADPTLEIVVSVFDEHNARGNNGSSTYPTTSNQEVFLSTFVLDTAGGFEVLFLTDPLRSNALLATLKGVPGVPATIERKMEFNLDDGIEKVETEWKISSALGDRIEFDAHYPSTSIFGRDYAPASRVVYTNINLQHVSDLIYRSAPTKTYPLFAHQDGSYLDLTDHAVHVKIRVKHHDTDVNAIFNDPANLPELLIAADRDVRIESR